MRTVVGPAFMALILASCGSGGQSGTDQQDVFGGDAGSTTASDDDVSDDDARIGEGDVTEDDANDFADDDSADDDSADDGGTDDSNDDDSNGEGPAGSDSGTVDAETCVLASDEWVEMSTLGIEWPEGLATGSISAVSGWAAGRMYVLDAEFRLFAFEPCANAWTAIVVDWTSETLDDDLGFASITGTRWVKPHFLVVGDGTDHTVAYLDPVAGSHRVGDDGRPDAPEWPLPPPAVERVTAQAANERYTFTWGGYVRNDATQIEESEPYTVPMGDGRLYDATTGSWTPVSDEGAPSARYLPAIAAVGDRFVVFGGFAEAVDLSAVAESALVDGAVYDPESDQWTPVDSANAPPFAEGEVTLNISGTGIHVRSDSQRAFFLNPNGSGGIYRPADDSWIRIQPAPAPLGHRIEFTNAGGVVDIASASSQVLDASTGEWSPASHGEPPTKPESSSWVVEAWSGTTLLRWGPQSNTTGGCENVPAGFGCDPYTEWTAHKLGAMRRLVP